jgi:hypothetical protein
VANEWWRKPRKEATEAKAKLTLLVVAAFIRFAATR